MNSVVSFVVGFIGGAAVGAVAYAILSNKYTDEVVVDGSKPSEDDEDSDPARSYRYPDTNSGGENGGSENVGAPAPSFTSANTLSDAYIFSQVEEKKEEARECPLQKIDDATFSKLLEDDDLKTQDLSYFKDGVWINDDDPYEPLPKPRVDMMLKGLKVEEFNDGESFFDKGAYTVYSLSKYDYAWKSMAYYPGGGE